MQSLRTYINKVPCVFSNLFYNLFKEARMVSVSVCLICKKIVVVYISIEDGFFTKMHRNLISPDRKNLRGVGDFKVLIHAEKIL